MNNKKKAFTMIELIIYTIILTVIWSFVSIIFRQFMDALAIQSRTNLFAQDFNDFQKKIYSNWYQGYSYFWDYWTGIVLNKDNKYLWYMCDDDYLWITYSYSWLALLDWEYLEKKYDNLDCNYLSWWSVWSWYWLDVWVDVSWLEQEFKYFIYK